MALLTPTYCVDSFANLPTQALREAHNILGLGLDLDGSLTSHHAEMVPAAHLDKLLEVAGFGIRMAILSNADSDERVARVERLVGHIRQETDLELPYITSQTVGHIKPHRFMFLTCAAVLDLPPQQMCYFGDQLPKDVLGANVANYGASVLCAPYGKGGNPKVVYMQRPLEALARPLLGLPFWTAGFGRTKPAAGL